MAVDLSPYTGFPLRFDPASLAVETPDSIVFERKIRRAGEVLDMLRDPQAAAPETGLYHLFYPRRLPVDVQSQLDRYDLTYSLVLMPPQHIGGEYVKTAGHYHPPIPGSHLTYPEVYTQLYGTLHLMLQRRDPDRPASALDCRIVVMKPGFSITIPPDYAHVLINTTDQPALMAGLYGRQFKPDYGFVREQRGLAYYVVAGPDGPQFERNTRYQHAPPLEPLAEIACTPFAYDDPGVPVWTSFLADTSRYAFLTRPVEAQARFENV